MRQTHSHTCIHTNQRQASLRQESASELSMADGDALQDGQSSISVEATSLTGRSMYHLARGACLFACVLT